MTQEQIDIIQYKLNRIHNYVNIGQQNLNTDIQKSVLMYNLVARESDNLSELLKLIIKEDSL